jgi:hypothetical protein
MAGAPNGSAVSHNPASARGIVEKPSTIEIRAADNFVVGPNSATACLSDVRQRGERDYSFLEVRSVKLQP